MHEKDIFIREKYGVAEFTPRHVSKHFSFYIELNNMISSDLHVLRNECDRSVES